MNSPSRELLSRVTTQVLEECAFLCAESCEGPVSWADDVVATVTFSGPERGQIELRAGVELTMALAADMLGVDANDPDATRLAENALGELLNVIAGTLVAQWFGTACLCELGIPVVEHVVGPPAAQGCELTLLDLEGRPVRVSVNLERAP